MSLDILRRPLKPGARYHDRRAGDEAEVEQVSNRRECSMAHANVVGMDDGDAVGGGKTKFGEVGVVIHWRLLGVES